MKFSHSSIIIDDIDSLLQLVNLMHAEVDDEVSVSLLINFFYMKMY